MNTVVEFAFPGLATALVFFVVVVSCPMRMVLLRYHWVVDIAFTACLMVLLAGTYSGAMTAAVGGLILTTLLWISNYLFVPIPPKEQT